MNNNGSNLSSSMTLPRAVALLSLVGGIALSGCSLDPRVPGPILSRLPPGQPGSAPPVPVLTPEELQRYDAIDRQVMQEQNEAMAAEAWSRYYGPYYAPPPVVYGGYGSGYSSGWSTGIGVGYGAPPGWW